MRDSPTQWLYGLGDAGFNLLWVLYDSFFLLFLVQASGLPTGLLSLVVFAGRFTDLIAGTLFGLFGSRLRTRFGSYRPWLIALTLPLCAGFTLLFTAPGSLSAPWTWIQQRGVIFSVAASMVFAVIYAIANAAYTALLSVLTSDAKKRVRLASARFAFAFVGSLAVQSLAIKTLTNHGGVGSATAWKHLALLLAVAAAFLILACAFAVREAVPAQRSRHTALRPMFAELIGASRLRWLLAAMFFCLIALSCRGGATLFYVQTTLGHAAWTGPALVANSVAAFAVCVSVTALPQRWLNPVRVARFSTIMGGAVSLLALCWTPASLPQLLTLQILYGLATGALLPALFSLLAEPVVEAPSVTPALQAALTLLALKAGAATGALLLSHAAVRSGQLITSDSLASWTVPFTVLPALFFAITLVCLFTRSFQTANPDGT